MDDNVRDLEQKLENEVRVTKMNSSIVDRHFSENSLRMDDTHSRIVLIEKQLKQVQTECQAMVCSVRYIQTDSTAMGAN